MIGRRTVIGLSLLSMLVFSAFAAQSASAAVSDNTTMYTCVQTGEGDFEDAHCDNAGPNAGEEEYEHIDIPAGETTEIEATNEKVTNSTKDSEPAVLKGTVGLTKTEVTCTVVKNKTSESLSHNIDDNNGEKHTLTGVAVVEYTKCTVNKPAKCTVKEPIVVKAEVKGVDKLGAGENEMGLQFKGQGAEPFTSITFEGAECALKGKTINVTGSAVGTGGVAQGKDHTGATLAFSPANGMQELLFGAAVAEFTSIVTVTMAKGGAPISTTTPT